MVPLLQDMFARFYAYRNVWNNAVACMAELDVLCSFAQITHDYKLVRPVVREKSETPFIRIK